MEKEFDLINIDSAQAWNDRIGEAKAVIDAIEKPKSVFGAVATHMNSEKIGMSGHSLGARTTMLLAGTALFPDGAKKALDFSDKRIDAALLMSAIGTNGKTVTKDSWKNVTVPMMVMSGSRDSRTRKETGEWRTESYQFAPNGDKYLVFLEGADHMTYIGPMRSDEPEDELPKSAPEKPSWFAREFPGMNEDVLFTYVRSASLAFWDAYLKDDAKAKAYLRGSALATFSDGLATLEHK